MENESTIEEDIDGRYEIPIKLYTDTKNKLVLDSSLLGYDIYYFPYENRTTSFDEDKDATKVNKLMFKIGIELSRFYHVYAVCYRTDVKYYDDSKFCCINNITNRFNTQEEHIKEIEDFINSCQGCNDSVYTDKYHCVLFVYGLCDSHVREMLKYDVEDTSINDTSELSNNEYSTEYSYKDMEYILEKYDSKKQ